MPSSSSSLPSHFLLQRCRRKHVSSATCLLLLFGVILFFLCTKIRLISGENVPDSAGSLEVVSVSDHGAVGDGHTDDAESFQRAWETACRNSSKAPLMLIPQGKTFLVGPTTFKGPCLSPIRVQIAGKMVAPDTLHSWDHTDLLTWISFESLTGLNVTGGGEINGQGETWWARSCKNNPSSECSPSAPSAITVSQCTYVVITGLNLVNSQQVHLNIRDSSDVFISYLNITAPGDSPNTDGIHLRSSQQVNIENCNISTGVILNEGSGKVHTTLRAVGLTPRDVHATSDAHHFRLTPHMIPQRDDCISIVTGSSEVNITRVYCGPGHGISIGSLGRGGKVATVERVAVKNAIFNGTTNGARIKTWQGGQGFVRNIHFEQLQFTNVSNPIIINQYYCIEPRECKNQSSAVAVRDVRYIDAWGTSSSEVAIKLACSESVPCDSIFLMDINISSTTRGKPTSSYALNVHGATSGFIIPPLAELPSVRNFVSTTLPPTLPPYWPSLPPAITTNPPSPADATLPSPASSPGIIAMPPSRRAESPTIARTPRSW